MLSTWRYNASTRELYPADFFIIRSPGDSNAYSKLEATGLGSIFEGSLYKIQKKYYLKGNDSSI